MSETELSRLKAAGLLHDIGKIAIESYLLDKKGSLTEQEYAEIQCHAEIGFRILGTIYEMQELAEGVLSHHERWDGRGYPQGLSGEAIPQMARIIALADSYDAMISERPYRQPMSEKEAIEEIKLHSGLQFDPVIARIFIEQVLGKPWQ